MKLEEVLSAISRKEENAKSTKSSAHEQARDIIVRAQRALKAEAEHLNVAAEADFANRSKVFDAEAKMKAAEYASSEIKKEEMIIESARDRAPSVSAALEKKFRKLDWR